MHRVKYVDAIAGFMIAWMILGHCSYFSHTVLPFAKFLGFYMPWFFYKSGMFFIAKPSMKLYINDARKLLRCYIVYSAIGWLIWCVCGLIDGSLSLERCIWRPIYAFIHQGSISANGALWFLLSLYIVRQIANLLINKKMPPPNFIDYMRPYSLPSVCNRLV